MKNNHCEEAKKRWGDIDAYKEYEQNHAGRSPERERDIADGLMDIFIQIGKLKDLPPQDDAVQAEIARLQNYITGHYYTCTDVILSGLGEMYVSDLRFRQNIDRTAGEGTAAFTSQAIKHYCQK